MPPQTQTPHSDFDRPTIIAMVVGAAAALLIYFLEPILIVAVPLFLIAAVAVGGYFARQFWWRTKGASWKAYQETEGAPPPPNSFNWIEHAVYRDSLTKKPQQQTALATGSRLEHELIVAGSGHGKTQLMEWQILQDLTQPDPPALIVIDSKADMVERLSRLALFDPDHGRLKERLIYIDPKDAPALNIFDVKVPNEEAANELISQLSYFLSSLLGTEVSSTMGVVFRPLCQLMMHIPGANLDTMSEAIDDIKRFTEPIKKLPERTQRFLLTDFPKILGTESKAAVKRRIYGMTMQSPSFDAMFNASQNKLDLTEALNQRKVVLINTSAAYLKDLSPVFGKFFISRAISAAMASVRRPAYIYIDEAAPYSDDKTEAVLTTMRSYKLGAILAYQNFARLPQNLQSTIPACTSIKFVGGGDDHTARIFARDLRCPPDFIMNQQKDSHEPPRFTSFALHVKNKLASAVSFIVPIANAHGKTELDRQSQMSPEAYQRMRESNRLRLQATEPEPPKRRGDSTVSDDN